MKPQLSVSECIQHANNVLEKVKYVAVATVGLDGEPWCSPVHATCDDHLNIYWASTRDATHSKNIRRTGRSFVTLFDSTQPEDEMPRGFYFRCTARELNDGKEIMAARKIMCAKAGGVLNRASTMTILPGVFTSLRLKRYG